MKNRPLSRRTFVKTGALALASTVLAENKLSAAGVGWPIGCFNRPWMQKFGSKEQPRSTPAPANWGFDAALEGVKEAGYPAVGLLTPMPGEEFTAANAPQDYLERLKGRIASAGLAATMGSLRVRPELPLSDAIADCRRQFDHAHFLGLEWMLTFGVDNEKDYAAYYHMMADAADYAAERNIKLVMKPHGGASSASEEILRCLKEVGRPNFKVWYDAGNIIYYTGKDPVEELKPVAQDVTGFCAKDCGGRHSDVMIQFGTGKVDFAAVYRELKRAGFNGSTFVECAGGKTFQEVTRGARENREFLERIFASL